MNIKSGDKIRMLSPFCSLSLGDERVVFEDNGTFGIICGCGISLMNFLTLDDFKFELVTPPVVLFGLEKEINEIETMGYRTKR